MIFKNKKALIFSSLLTLLPILAGLLLWDKFPEQMATHWGFDGQPDGYSSIPFAVFVPPLIMLACQWLCIYFTAKDPGNKDRNGKPLTLVLWIIPVISNLSCGIMYALALGVDISVERIMSIALGLMFAAIGNYLPKCKMNSTMGIKIPWTYSSEENWNVTHRMAGKLWVIGGLILVLSLLLPSRMGMLLFLPIMLVMILVPMFYSYLFYRKQKAQGVELHPFPKLNTKGSKASTLALIAVLIFTVCVMFTGEISFHFREDSLMIDTNMYSDHFLYYNAIESIELREGNVDGTRVGGFGSARLLMGYFENEEFGTYIRYTYTKPESCIVITLRNSTLVVSGKTAEETQGIYQELLTRVK